MAHLEYDPLRYMGLLDHSRAVDAPEAARPAREGGPALLVGDLAVEWRSLAGCRLVEGPWRALAERAIEPNVFYEPDFLLAAHRHLPEAAGHGALLVWDMRGAEEPRLLGFWPALRPRRLALVNLVRGFASRYSCSGAPLLDSRFAVEVSCALIGALQRMEQGPAGALFGQLALDGDAARALRSAATLSGLPTYELDVHARACVWLDPAEDGASVKEASGRAAKRRSEMRRVARGLSRHGDLRLVTATRPDAVRDAMELFLALEASGWKAARGTAILSQTRDAAFYRTMTRALSQSGKVAVHVLEAGETMAAAGLVMRSGGRSWYVKTSYAEALAAHAPGALLSHQIGECMRERGEGELLDSCAVPGHRMIERVWSDRMRIGDLAIGLTDSASAAMRRETLRRRLRQAAKQVYHRAQRWRS